MLFHVIIQGNKNAFKNCRIYVLQSSVYFRQYPIINSVATSANQVFLRCALALAGESAMLRRPHHGV